MKETPPRSASANDHAGVIAFPPLLWLINAILSLLPHFLFPHPLARYGAVLPFGIALVILAPALVIWAARTMKIAGTNVNPSEPALLIVRAGPYRVTRNPMYLGLCLLQAALGFLFNDWITLLFVIPLALTLHYGVILREEHYLEAKFGPPYLDLKRTVRRWI